MVAPEADPRRITLAFDGIDRLSIDPQGNLRLQTAHGELVQQKPVSFPGASGSAIQPSLRGGSDVFVAKLNAAGTALVYSTYLGGSASEIGRAIAVDGAGSACVTGHTNSLNFPVAAALQPGHGSPGSYDAFVTKFRWQRG